MARAHGDGFDDVATIERPQAAAPGAETVFFVHVVQGPDAGKSVVVDGAARVLVGTGPVCTLVLADREVSRRHLALDLARHRLRVTDLGSTNGTFVNGLGVADAFLVGGERLAIGATVLEVALRRQAPPPPLPHGHRFGRLIGASAAMRRLYPLCERIARANVPVILEGDTGTGKEVLAESLHEASARAAGPFVVFDCTAHPPNLIEAALFGHERGAFTGAVDARPGVFEEANGGTLLIDEIGELEIGLQAKLLRALERGEVRRLGGKSWIKVDARVVSATRRDLDQEVQGGRFRDDLFFRLAVARVELPPLRARDGDVTLLTRHFWSALGGAGAPPRELEERFERYAWPGNVRELRNAVARQIALGELAEEGRARASFAPPPLPPSPSPASASASERPIPYRHILELDLPLPRARKLLVDEFERAYVERVLMQHGGNVARAAEASGLARRYFQLLRARQK